MPIPRSRERSRPPGRVKPSPGSYTLHGARIGRPPKPPEERMQSGFFFRFTAAQLAIVSKAALAAGLPTTASSRRVVLAQVARDLHAGD